LADGGDDQLVDIKRLALAGQLQVRQEPAEERRGERGLNKKEKQLIHDTEKAVVMALHNSNDML